MAFFYYSSGMPLCPWFKFALYSFLAVFNVAVVNLNVALHSRGNCTSLVFYVYNWELFKDCFRPIHNTGSSALILIYKAMLNYIH